MNRKQLILASCAMVALSFGTAQAGPCEAGKSANMQDAGSGPTPGNTGNTVGMATTAGDKQHPPTSTMNRSTGDVAASAEDAQKQMQAQPTDAQRAQGANPSALADKDC